MKTRHLASIAGAALLAAASASAQQAVLKVGYGPFAQPVQFLPGATNDNYKTFDATGDKASGALVDLMRAIAKDAGLQVQFVAAPAGDYNPAGSGSQIPLSDGRTVDIALANGGSASPNAVLFDFTAPVFNNGDCVLTLKTDSKQYTSWDDLKGMVVAVQKGQPADGAAQKSGLFKDVKVYDNGPALEKAVSTGEVQAGLCASALVESAKFGPAALPADQALGIQMVKSFQMKFPVATSIAVRKGNMQLLNTLNASLAKLKADGTVKATFAKYGIDAVVVN